MNENQKKFLKDFDDLMRKYSITKVTTRGEFIDFVSNEQMLSFKSDNNGRFEGIETFIPEYEVKDE